MNKNGKLAIITPVYNTELYLRDYYESLANQTYKNFDLFIVDDGSTDGSLQLLEELERNDKRITLIRKENGGVSSARNVALEKVMESKEKYSFLYFMDSDDKIECRFLERCIQLITNTDSDLAVTSYTELTIKDQELRFKKSRFEAGRILSKMEMAKQYFEIGDEWKNDSTSNRFLNNKLFSLHRIDLKNFFFDEKLLRSNDMDLMISLLGKIQRAVIASDVFFYYRMRKSAITNTKRSGDLLICKKILENRVFRDVSSVEYIALKSLLDKTLYKSFSLSITAKDRDLYKETKKIYEKSISENIFDENSKHAFFNKAPYLIKYVWANTRLVLMNKKLQNKERHYFE